MRTLLGASILLAVFLGGGELIVRLSLPMLRAQSPGYYYRQFFESIFVPSPNLIWAGRAGEKITIANPEGREISYSLNSAGWRAAPLNPAARKVLLLGDSFTFGTGVQEGERYGDELAHRFPGTVFYPAALMGYGVGQYQILAEEMLGQGHWAAMVVQLSNNDLADMVEFQRAESAPAPTPSFELVGLFQYLKKILHQGARSEGELTTALLLLEQGLGRIASLAAERKVPLILILATDWGQPVYGQALAKEYEAAVKRIATKHKLPFLAVGAGFTLADLLPFPDLHWRPETHRRVAERLVPLFPKSLQRLRKAEFSSR